MRLAGEGASADAKGWAGPAVVAAAANGRMKAVEALLRLGCDPNAPNKYGWTALMWAAYKGHGGVVGALLEHGGAELDAVDSQGMTALMRAANWGEAAVAAQLVEAGADATLRATCGDHEGQTALEIAERYGQAEVAALLRSAAEPGVRALPPPLPPQPPAAAPAPLGRCFPRVCFVLSRPHPFRRAFSSRLFEEEMVCRGFQRPLSFPRANLSAHPAQHSTHLPNFSKTFPRLSWQAAAKRMADTAPPAFLTPPPLTFCAPAFWPPFFARANLDAAQNA